MDFTKELEEIREKVDRRKIPLAERLLEISHALQEENGKLKVNMVEYVQSQVAKSEAQAKRIEELERELAGLKASWPQPPMLRTTPCPTCGKVEG